MDKEVAQQYFEKPWYLKPWLIALMFAGWIFILPAVVGIALVVYDVKDTRKKRERIKALHYDKLASLDNLEQELDDKKAFYKTLTSVDDARLALKRAEKMLEDKNELYATLDDVAKAKQVLTSTQQEIEQAQKQLEEKGNLFTTLDTVDKANNALNDTEKKSASLAAQVAQLNSKLIAETDEVEMQEFGFYGQDFEIGTSGEYKAKMIALQDQQKQMVKNKTASDFSLTYTFNGSRSEGNKLVNKEVKIALWAFNTHCDNVIAKVTYRNKAACEKKIERAYEIINENETLQHIKHEYLALKLEELNTTYLYKQAIENEKELLREQREKQREDKKLQMEIAMARAKLEKDETHFNTELARLHLMLQDERSDKAKVQNRLAELTAKLQEIQKQKEVVDYRETHALAGYVYIISNIGSFGEGVYKIGVTRRLEPLDRINELGDASVPFRFDIHALVFSDEAFKLEHALHERFKKFRVNKINNRREFYRLPLEDVRKAVDEEFKAIVNFDMTPEAKEYRESLALSTTG